MQYACVNTHIKKTHTTEKHFSQNNAPPNYV